VQFPSPTSISLIPYVHRYPGDRVIPGSAIAEVRFTDSVPRPFPPACERRGPASVTPIARTAHRSCRPLIGPLMVGRSAPARMAFARIHPQNLTCGGVNAAKSDLSGVAYGEIAISPPVPQRGISLSSSVSSPSQGRRNGGCPRGRITMAIGHPRLARTPRSRIMTRPLGILLHDHDGTALYVDSFAPPPQ
jgi:hypothetical protein